MCTCVYMHNSEVCLLKVTGEVSPPDWASSIILKIDSLRQKVEERDRRIDQLEQQVAVIKKTPQGPRSSGLSKSQRATLAVSRNRVFS